jgi:uncharacterized protein YhbP (UPF0306 family)
MKNFPDVKQRIIEVLEKGYLLSIGTIDEGGPWVSDVRYVSDDDFKIYWMSDPACRHSLAIEKNPKVGATVEINFNFGTPNLGLQISGKVKKLGMIISPSLAIKYMTRRGKPKPSQISSILKSGYSWYELTPEFIELNDEENFGFDNKQKMILS